MIPETTSRMPNGQPSNDLVEASVEYTDRDGEYVRLTYGKFLRDGYSRGKPVTISVKGLRAYTFDDEPLCDFWVDRYPILANSPIEILKIFEEIKRERVSVDDLETEIANALAN